MLHFHFKGDNPQPSEHESLPVTTRPGLPPNHYSNLKKQFQKSRRSRLRTFYAFLIFWKFDFYVCKFFSSFSSKLNWKLLHYIQTLSTELANLITLLNLPTQLNSNFFVRGAFVNHELNKKSCFKPVSAKSTHFKLQIYRPKQIIWHVWKNDQNILNIFSKLKPIIWTRY